MANINLVTGVEGSRHDPYGWTDIHFECTNGVYVVYHSSGLGIDWCEIYEKRGGLLVHKERDEKKAEECFESTTGISIYDATNYYWKCQCRKRSKCPKCGCRDICASDGYPGETIYLCKKCNEVVDCEMNYSVIE